jgi:hypothetical protein
MSIFAKMTTNQEIDGIIEKLGGRKIIHSWRYTMYYINGVRIELYKNNSSDPEKQFVCCCLADDNEHLYDGYIHISSIQDILVALPSNERYSAMKNRHQNRIKTHVHGNIVNANKFHKEYMDKTVKYLSEKGVVFIDKNKCQFYADKIPVELIYWDSDHHRTINNYLCYVLDSVKNRTEIVYEGSLRKISKNLPSIEEYTARFGAEGKSAALKK